MRKLAGKLAVNIFYKCYFIYASVTIRCRYFHEYNWGKLKYLSKEDYKIWLSAMLSLMKEHCSSSFGFGTRLVYEAFAKANIEVVRHTEANVTDTPIIVLSVKDDMQRLQMLVEHYRQMGVKKFAFLDNGSTDGTYEWMLGQKDIDLFRTEDKYNCFVKEGWLNRIISYYGFNKWYILTDSDELFTYIGMEEHPLKELIHYAENHGIKRFKGLNLDMYADAPLFSMESKDIDIKSAYAWMDTDSYNTEKRKIGSVEITAVTGGPRFRVMDVPCSVMKYPLVYFAPGTVSANAHYQYPYDIIEDSLCCIGILHYKFLDTDKKEFERRSHFDTGISAGNAQTGKYYRQYLNAAKESISFMYGGSVKFENSDALKNIEMIEAVPFE